MRRRLTVMRPLPSMTHTLATLHFRFPATGSVLHCKVMEDSRPQLLQHRIRTAHTAAEVLATAIPCTSALVASPVA